MNGSIIFIKGMSCERYLVCSRPLVKSTLNLLDCEINSYFTQMTLRLVIMLFKKTKFIFCTLLSQQRSQKRKINEAFFVQNFLGFNSVYT